jgi:hypothetical protein
MGRKPTRKIPGIWVPTAAAVGPSDAVRVYAGAIQEMPITVAPRRPIDPALRPLEEIPVDVSGDVAAAGVVGVGELAMGSILRGQ